jgi:hypothetical protein
MTTVTERQPERRIISMPIEKLGTRVQLDNFFLQSKNSLQIPEPLERDRERVLQYIADNNETARMIHELDHGEIIKKEKRLKGNCKTGTVICIDGRISIIHQFGRTANVWEIAGSLVESERRSDGKVYLTTHRLIDALQKTSRASEGRDLLEIVTAHTSHDLNHKCGKMTGLVDAAGLSREAIDRKALQAAELRAQAIENTYNEIRKSQGKAPQAQVAITAMIDTDTMGFILNFGKENVLSTSDILMNTGLLSTIHNDMQAVAGNFGSMKETFAVKDKIIEYSQKVEAITRYLMHTEIQSSNSVIKSVKSYIDAQFPNLSPSQKQALEFTFCRTIATQYVTGLSGEHFNHPYNEHGEKYISVSPFGKSFGRHDYTQQSFGSTPNNRKEALDQIKIKLSIMSKHGGSGEAKIIYISNPIKRSILIHSDIEMSSTYAEIIDSNRAYYEFLYQDEELKSQIHQQKLILVPLLVDEDTGEVLKIMDDSPLYINQGTPLTEMPE